LTPVEEETALIAELEKSYPKDTNSTEWHIHHTKVRDAYWRRRMKASKSDEEKDAASRVY
jgi:hypothetical protein